MLLKHLLFEALQKALRNVQSTKQMFPRPSNDGWSDILMSHSKMGCPEQHSAASWCSIAMQGAHLLPAVGVVCDEAEFADLGGINLLILGSHQHGAHSYLHKHVGDITHLSTCEGPQGLPSQDAKVAALFEMTEAAQYELSSDKSE